MNERPDWLPGMLELDGDWDIALSRLYAIFERDIKNGHLLCKGMPVCFDRRVLPDDTHGYEEGFWHVVTRNEFNNGKKERLFDSRRAERLPWLSPVVRHIFEPEVEFWKSEGSNRRLEIYVWLKALDYVAVFAHKHKKCGPVAFLMTAFHVDGESTRRNLRKKYERRIVEDV